MKKLQCIIKILESYQKSTAKEKFRAARMFTQQSAVWIPKKIISKAKGLTKKPLSVAFIKIPGTGDILNKAQDVLYYLLDYFKVIIKSNEAYNMELNAYIELNQIRQNADWYPYLKLTE